MGVNRGWYVGQRPGRLCAVWAIAAQRALSGHYWPGGVPVRVRMGLHSGEPVWHEDEYVGLDVHRAARIAAVAHGGQVVLSEATRQLAGSRLPAGASLRDLGLHRLKDIEAPEHIYQLVAVGLKERFPPLKTTLAEAAGPAAGRAAPIVGRVAERQALLALYARVVAGRPQVLLITGAAGILDESDLGFGGDRLSAQDWERDRGNGHQEAAELHSGLADQALTLMPIAHNLAVLDLGPGPKPVDKPEPPSILQSL